MIESRLGVDKNRNLFFFNDTATTEIYTLSLHDALPIYRLHRRDDRAGLGPDLTALRGGHVLDELLDPGVLRQRRDDVASDRSEEHTSELQSRQYLVCRLLLENKKFTSIF